MSAFLPQAVPGSARRQGDLDSACLLYRFNHSHVSPLAVVDQVPVCDDFSFGWLMHVGSRVMDVLQNRSELTDELELEAHVESKLLQLQQLIIRSETAITDLRQFVCDALKLEGRIGAKPVRPETLESYAGLFRTIGLPPVSKDYRNDRNFAWMRVAGPNPTMLRCMGSRDERILLTDEQLRLASPGDSLDAAFAERRLFLADYAALDGVELGTSPVGQKYVYAPLAVFVALPKSGDLLPVAIQSKQRPGADNPVFTPADGFNWLIAKTIVEIADGNLHEPFAHLGRTHLFIEPFVVATCRQLSVNHPLAVLLRPHFQGTLAINAAAWRFLIANNGAVDKLCGATIACSRTLAAKGVQSAEVMNLLLPRTFTDRGVENEKILRDYPYRDDSLLFWNAIRNWVSAYVGLYYRADAEVVADAELQAWSRELAATEGGRIRGLPNGGAFHSTAELTDVLTLVIYTCSVQHAAVNFPQYDLMSYVPNMPLAGYRPAPTTKQWRKRGRLSCDVAAAGHG